MVALSRHGDMGFCYLNFIWCYTTHGNSYADAVVEHQHELLLNTSMRHAKRELT